MPWSRSRVLLPSANRAADNCPKAIPQAMGDAARAVPPPAPKNRPVDLEHLPFPDASFDCVISNGVVNLSADKPEVFREAARVLCAGGRFVLADIVTERPLTPQIVCSADLWAACIGGAAQLTNIVAPWPGQDSSSNGRKETVMSSSPAGPVRRHQNMVS
jgi:SAM-dependent methyltransferase